MIVIYALYLQCEKLKSLFHLKRKAMRKFILLSLIIAAITAISACSDAVDDFSSDREEMVNTEQLIDVKQKKAEEAGDLIMSSLVVTKADGEWYPDYFGGIYIKKL